MISVRIFRTFPVSRMRQPLIAHILGVLVCFPAVTLAQPIQVALTPGDEVHVTCTGEWGPITSSPDVSVACLEDGSGPPPTGPIVVNHTSVALFDQIPPAYLNAAGALRVLFRTASVGQNISEGLNCLANNTGVNCRTGFGVPASSVPIVSRPQYQRPRWLLEYRGNPGWYGKASDYITQVQTRHASFDVMTWKQSYVDDPSLVNFWTRGRTGPDIGDVEAALAAAPTVTGVFWTAALPRITLPHITTFNTTMRLYAQNEQAILFDLADLESHTPAGTPCVTNGHPVICTAYNNEVDGGHLTNGMAQQHIAKAFWVLAARLAGWQP